MASSDSNKSKNELELIEELDILRSRIAEDVAEKRLKEKQLRLTQFVVKSINDATYWINPQGRIFDVNESACRMLGYSRDELLSMPVPDIDPDVSEEKWPEVWDIIKTRKTHTFEFLHIIKTVR